MKQREKIVPLARGRVLEVGIGSGLNLSFYRPEQVERVWGLDPSLELQERARSRATAAGVEVEFLGLSGEEIPIEAGYFDTVVVTYTLCSISDVSRALEEMARVLKPGGQLLFSEHGIAPDPRVSRRQKSFDRWWSKLSGGCHLTRPVPELLRRAGFRLEDVNAAYLPGPKALTYNYWGVARTAR